MRAKDFVNYTTTANFAAAITNPVPDSPYTSMLVRNESGEDIQITIDNFAGTIWQMSDGDVMLIDQDFSCRETVWARYAPGGSGASGLLISVWTNVG